MNREHPAYGCYSVDFSKLTWNYSGHPPREIPSETLELPEIPERHVSAWDLRTKIRDEDNNVLTNSLNPLEIGSSLVRKELSGQKQLHQSSSSKSFSLFERKSESADSIPRQVQCSEINGNYSSAASSPCSLRSIFETAPSASHLRYYPPRVRRGRICFNVPKREDANLHLMLGNLKISDAHSQMSKKLKKQQKFRRDLKLCERIMSEIVPGIAKMKCHDTGEECSSPGHV